MRGRRHSRSVFALRVKVCDTGAWTPSFLPSSFDKVARGVFTVAVSTGGQGGRSLSHSELPVSPVFGLSTCSCAGARALVLRPCQAPHSTTGGFFSSSSFSSFLVFGAAPLVVSIALIIIFCLFIDRLPGAVSSQHHSFKLSLSRANN